MPVALAHALLWLATAYAAAGLFFALLFVTLGVPAVDHATRGSPWTFRLVILPGSAALWPLLLRRWLSVRRRARPCDPATRP